MLSFKLFQLRPDPAPKALPLDHAGGSAQDPCCKLALRVLTVPPPLPNPKYATEDLGLED